MSEEFKTGIIIVLSSTAIFTALLALLFHLAKKEKKAFNEEINTVAFQLKVAEALIKHFRAARIAQTDTNIIGGFKCEKCDKTFSLDINDGCNTIVCPHCFHVTSDFKKVSHENPT